MNCKHEPYTHLKYLRVSGEANMHVWWAAVEVCRLCHVVYVTNETMEILDKERQLLAATISTEDKT